MVLGCFAIAGPLILPEPSSKWQLAHRAANIWPPVLVAAFPLVTEKSKMLKQKISLRNLSIDIRLDNPKRSICLLICLRGFNKGWIQISPHP